MSRPFSNSKTRIPNLERQNREKRDKTYVSSDDIKKIKTEIEASILAENAKIELNYNKAVESYKDVKDGQVKEFEKETKTLVDDTLVKDFNQIDNKYRDTYLELANDLVKDSKMTTKQKTDIFNLLSVLDERIKNKMYQKKLVNFDDISKSAAVIPNNLSTAEQDHIRFNPDYSASTMSDTVELPRDKEILLGVLEELPVEYRSVDLENSDIGAFIMQMKLRGNNIAIDLYLTNTLLTDNKYGTAVVSESAYNMDNSLMVCVYKELNTNKVYFTLKNVEYEKIRETLILTTSYNVLLGGKFTLPDEMGMLFIPDSNKYKRIGDGVIKGNEEGIVGPVNNVLIERDFYNNILQHIGLSESNIFGETVKVRINSIAKEIENADVNVIESRFNTTKDLKKAIENDPIIIDEDEILQVVDSEEDGRFIDNEPYKTYYDKVTKTLYIGSNWGLFAYNFTTQKTKNYTDIPKPVNKIKFDVKDNTLDVATDKGFFRIHNLGSDSERIEKKDLDFKVWNDKLPYVVNYTGSSSLFKKEEPDTDSSSISYSGHKTFMNMRRIVKGRTDECYKKCENYQVKDFMHITTDLDSVEMMDKNYPDYTKMVAKPEESTSKLPIYDVILIDDFKIGFRKEFLPGWSEKYKNKSIQIGLIKNSSDFLIKELDDNEWTKVVINEPDDCVFKTFSSGVYEYDNEYGPKGLLAALTSTNKLYISSDIYTWREVSLPEEVRDNVWEDIKWVSNYKPDYLTQLSTVTSSTPRLGTWILISSSGVTGKRILASVDGENWMVVPNLPSEVDQHEWKFILTTSLTTEELALNQSKWDKDLNGGSFGAVKNLIDTGLCEIITDVFDYNKSIYLSNGTFTYAPDCKYNNIHDSGYKQYVSEGYTKISKMNWKIRLNSVVREDLLSVYQLLLRASCVLYNPSTNKKIYVFKNTFATSDYINDYGSLYKYDNWSELFSGRFVVVDRDVVNYENTNVLGVFTFAHNLVLGDRSFRCAIFEKLDEEGNNVYIAFDSGFKKGGGIIDYYMDSKETRSRKEALINTVITEGHTIHDRYDNKPNPFIKINLDDYSELNGGIVEKLITFYDNKFNFYFKTQESVSSEPVEHYFESPMTKVFQVNSDEPVRKISENYLYNIVIDRYMNARGKGTQEKTFVYREAKIYSLTPEGEKDQLVKETKQLIGSSHIIEFFHALTNKTLTQDKWPFEVVNNEVECVLKAGRGGFQNVLMQIMTDLFLSNYEIPLGRLDRCAMNQVGSTGDLMYVDEIESCDETPTSLNTKNIAFIPYKKDGKRNFAIVVGKADRNPYPRQAKEKNYLEMGQIILTDFNEEAIEMDSLPYSYMDERHFDYVYSRDTMNIRNTALHMCDSYPDYDPENQYIYDRRNSIVHVLREGEENTEYVGRRYLRGNDSVMTNFVHIPHLKGYIFGDNYNWFYREAANHEEFLNHKNILYGEDKLGYAGNIVVLTDLDGTNTLVKIDNESNTMVVLDRYETYTQMNNEWENIAFPHPYKKNCQDTDGITLYKALEAAGVPYDVPCKCSGYVIINGRKYSIAQVYITEPYDMIEDEYHPGEFIEYGCLQLLFEPNSKMVLEPTMISALYGTHNDKFIGGNRTDSESYSKSTGLYPGIRMGSYSRIAGRTSLGLNSKTATQNYSLSAWLSPLNGYTRYRNSTMSSTFFTTKSISDTYFMTKSAIQVQNKIFMLTKMNYNEVDDGYLYIYDTIKNVWEKKCRWFSSSINGLSAAQPSQLMSYDENSEIIFYLHSDSATSRFMYSTDYGDTWNEVECEKGHGSAIAIVYSTGLYIKDNICYRYNDKEILGSKILGIETRKTEYTFDKELDDYKLDETYGDSIKIVNKRVAINNEKYEEVFFKDWEDPTSRYLHTEENTEPTVWAKLLAGEEVLCESDHGQTSLVRKTEWGTTDDRGFTDQIHIVYKGPRYEKVLISNEGEPEKYGIAEYSVFSVYSRDMVNILDRYENHSGIYIGDRKVHELPYNHGYDKKFVLSPVTRGDSLSDNGRKYNVISTILIYQSGSADYLISHDGGDSWFECTAPEPIKDIYNTSNGIGVIMVPENKEGSDKVIYISLTYGDDFDHKVKTNNQYLFNGIMMKNEENFLVFSADKTNIYLNVPMETEEDVEESVLPLKFSVSELYYFDNTQSNTVMLLDHNNDSTLEKVLLSDDNGGIFKVLMNDSEYHTLINIKSNETDPTDNKVKRRILQWNRRLLKIKEVWINPNNVEGSKLRIEKTSSKKRSLSSIMTSNSMESATRINKMFYDERIKKWVILMNGYNEANAYVLLSSKNFIESDDSEIEVIKYNMGAYSLNISNKFCLDLDVYYSKNINRNILYFSFSNNGNTSSTKYKILDINYKQENFTITDAQSINAKIHGFYDDPVTKNVYLLRADNGVFGNITDEAGSSVNSAFPNICVFDSKYEKINELVSNINVGASSNIGSFYYDSKFVGWYPLTYFNGFDGKIGGFVSIGQIGGGTIRILRNNIVEEESDKYYTDISKNIDKLAYERRYSTYATSTSDYSNLEPSINNGGWETTRQMFTQGFDLTVMFSKRKMIKNKVETI